MFLGHFAVGFACKRFAPRTSLALLVAAPLLLDILWPLFLLAGIERVEIHASENPFWVLTFTSYPWSHSLLMALVWGGVLGGAYYALARTRVAGIVLFLGVVSHWVLDVVTHRPDLPWTPWSERLVGLGLWGSPPATIAVESILFALGVWSYTAATRSRDGIGRWVWWALVALLAVTYVWSLGGTPPPGVAPLAWMSIVATLIISLLAWWLDRHRIANPESG